MKNNSTLSTWFAFSLMEEDAFELKRKIGEVMNCNSFIENYRWRLTPQFQLLNFQFLNINMLNTQSLKKNYIK